MSDVNVTVIGYVGQTPTLYVSDSGTKWTSIRVASTRRRPSPEGWIDGETIWFTVRAYDSKALNVVESITKGTPVVVVGRLAVEEYQVRKTPDSPLDEPTNVTRTTQVIEHATIAVDISRGVAKWQRVVHTDLIPPDAPPTYASEPSGEQSNVMPFGSDASTCDAINELESEFELEPVAG